MTRFLLIISGFLVSGILSAQFCSTPQAPLLDRIEELRKSVHFHSRGAQKYIPVTFHLVANSAGSGRVTEEEVLRQLANLNVQYGDQEAIFYIDRLNYFNNDAVYETPSSSAATIQMRLRKDNNSVNVFITNKADSNSGGPGVTLAYYDPQEDWIVSRKSQINGVSSTLAHETGHFFSLPHPHAGWDCHPFTLDEYTNPVNVDFTLACEGGGGSVRIELQDGSNCTIAGDRICDTPPDYNLGLLYQNDCDPNTTIRDKNGTLIQPMVNNFMGYYNDCATYAFTPTQKNMINADFFSPQRAYIRTGVTPNTNPVNGPVTYISPINGEETSGSTNIVLDWEDLENANQYLVILARNQSFTIDVQKFIVEESMVTLDEPLQDGMNYYWRVWPFNESQTGAGYGPTQNFRVGTGVGVNNITEVSGYQLSPNPVQNINHVTLSLSTTHALQGELNLTDGAGNLIMTRPVSMHAGTTFHEVKTGDLASGVYFLTLKTSGGILVERFLKL